MFFETRTNGTMIKEGVEEGVVIGVVTEVYSDKKRIGVNFPWRNKGSNQSKDENDQNQKKDEILARLASTSKSSPVLPNEGDQVLVAFEHGRFNSPIIIGVIWK